MEILIKNSTLFKAKNKIKISLQYLSLILKPNNKTKNFKQNKKMSIYL